MKNTKKRRNQKGALTIEASISYSIFLMIIVTMLYLMKIVYTYGLVQHAVNQTAKELSTYTYIYHVSGVSGLYNDLQGASADRKKKFNDGMDSLAELYHILENAEFEKLDDYKYEGSKSLVDIIKDTGGAVLNEAGENAHNALWENLAKPMIGGYIGADSKGHSADERLQTLRVKGGLDGINLSSSSFFEDGKIDIVACYTIDPLLPLDILPELNLCNRACVQGVKGESIFGK